MTHEELEDMVRRHELDIADLGKQNEQFTASVKSFVLAFPSAIGEEEGASFGRSSSATSTT
jgi:hypothetical protein